VQWERLHEDRVGFSSFDSGEVIAMLGGVQCALGSSAAAALLILVALEVSVAAVPAQRGVDPVTVDRTNKGDLVARPRAGMSTRQAPQPRLPEGCAGASDWRRGSIYAIEIAGRCVV